MPGSLKQGITHAIMQAFQPALEQALNHQWAVMQTLRDSVYGCGTTMKIAGSIDRYKFISGRQPYKVALAHSHMSINRL